MFQVSRQIVGNAGDVGEVGGLFVSFGEANENA